MFAYKIILFDYLNVHHRKLNIKDYYSVRRLDIKRKRLCALSFTIPRFNHVLAGAIVLDASISFVSVSANSTVVVYCVCMCVRA